MFLYRTQRLHAVTGEHEAMVLAQDLPEQRQIVRLVVDAKNRSVGHASFPCRVRRDVAALP